MIARRDPKCQGLGFKGQGPDTLKWWPQAKSPPHLEAKYCSLKLRCFEQITSPFAVWHSSIMDAWPHVAENLFVFQAETGWDPLLQQLHIDWPFLQQQNTKKLQGTKNNWEHVQLGPSMDKRYTKTKKTQLPLLKSQGQKQGTAHASWTQHHQKAGQTT